MAINELVNKIHSLNKVQNEFWKGYLERIRKNFTVTWYHSSGFDLRPLQVVYTLSNIKVGRWSRDYTDDDKLCLTIGNELQNTEFVYSDSCVYYDYYNILLNIWNGKNESVFDDIGMPSKNFNGSLLSKSFLSIEPFSIFTNEERKAMKYSDEDIYLIEDQEYDGFAIKLAGYNKSYITIIFLCLDDRIVKKLFEDYNINLICLFENATGGEGGGINFDCLFKNYKLIKNIKYIFSDSYYGGFKGENIPLKLNNFISNDFRVWDFWDNNMNSLTHGSGLLSTYMKHKYTYSSAFCLAIRKNNE